MDYRFSGILVRYVEKDSANARCPVCAQTESLDIPALQDGAADAEAGLPNAADTIAPSGPAGQAADRSSDDGTDPVESGGVDSGDKAPSKAKAFRDELHVNLWELEKDPFLDIGIMISEWRNYSALQIDLPWEVTPRQVGDIGALLNSEKAVAAVFNEIVDYRGQADKSYAEVSFQQQPGGSGQSEPFLLLRLNFSQFDVQPQTLSDGSICSRITVRIPEEELDKPADRIYMRLRIRGIPEEVYSTHFDQRDRNLLSSSTETRIIDFRVNVRRGIPDEVLSSSKRCWFPEFRKIHFFLTVARTEICEFQSKDFIGCRSLVDEREWTQYVRSQDDPNARRASSVKDYLGYQWTAKAESGKWAKDLLILGRFTRHRSNIVQIVRFVALGLLFGMIGNGLWDVIKPDGQHTSFLTRLKNPESLDLIGIAILIAILIMVQRAFYIRLVKEVFWNMPRRVFRLDTK